MNKEAILHRHAKFWNHKGEVAVDGIDTMTPESAIYKAMDEYSKQQAFAFQDFVEKNYHPFMGRGRYMVQIRFDNGELLPDLNKVQTFSKDELYQLFLSSQKQPLKTD